MKKAIFLGLVLSFILSGCTIENNNISSFNRSCSVDVDCISTCACGCINKNASCKADEFTDCNKGSYLPANCQCVNNVCQKRKKLSLINTIELKDEEKIEVRCYKCKDCGCDIYLLRTADKIGHAPYKDTFECLNGLTKVDGMSYQYSLKKAQFLKLHNCLNK